MTIVSHSITREDAERFAERIRMDLEGAADRIESAKLKIRTALTERHDLALGYASPGAYLADRFSDALSRLGVDSRREFVAELDAAGLSTRAIGSVVGVSHKTIVKDRQAIAGGTQVPPAPAVDTETGEVSDNFPAPEVLPAGKGGAAVTPPTEARVEPPTPRASVTGLDGKTYPRPEVKAPKRKPYLDDLAGVVHVLSGAAEKLHALMCDSRFTQKSEKAAAENRDDLLRIISVLQDATQRMS